MRLISVAVSTYNSENHHCPSFPEEVMELILIVLLVVFLFGGGGYYGYRRWR